MKGIVLAASLLLLSACDSSQTADDASSASDNSVMERIAGDKNQMAELMRLSHQKGTFDDALAAAMTDSTLASTLFEVALMDERFAVITAEGTPAATPGIAPSQTKTGSSSPAASPAPAKRSTTPAPATTPQRQGDVLDNAEEAARKANERLEQAERVKREAEAAKRKVEVILGR